MAATTNNSRYKEFREPSVAGTKIKKKEKDRLVTEYATLVRYIAQKISIRLPANIELDDLISSGVIGLMDAIDKFDPSRDNKFKTYAEFRIRGAILDELRAQDWVPRSVREKSKMVERAIAALELKLGRVPSEEEVANHLEMNLGDYQTLLDSVRSISLLSLDDTQGISKVDRRNLLNTLEISNKNTPQSNMSFKMLQDNLSGLIRNLPEKQKLVLSLYYYEDLNLKEIAKVLEVTESRVSQLHTQGILRLKAKLRTTTKDLVGD